MPFLILILIVIYHYGITITIIIIIEGWETVPRVYACTSWV